MDEVNDMDFSSDLVEQPPGTWRRREFLTKAAAAGVVAWSAPVILSRPAYALDGGGGTPTCRPTFTLSCVLHDCGQGNKQFPGFTITPNPLVCPCSDTVPPQNATTCIKITPKVGQTEFKCNGDTVVAYGAGTNCAPGNKDSDVIFTLGDWECLTAANLPVFFGKARSGGNQNGAISNLSSCNLEFRVAIWAGSCPDADSPDEAFTCQTFNVKICYDSSGASTVVCQDTPACPGGGFSPAPDAHSLCTFDPPDEPPGGCSCP